MHQTNIVCSILTATHTCWRTWRLCFNFLYIFFFYRKLVTNREWCGSLKYYTNCRQTWAIENFFSHTLLHYCPKQNSFSYDSYHIRNMLAVLDHNKHIGRAVRVGEDGEPYIQAQVSRRSKQWVAYQKKCPKDFKYIPGNTTIPSIHSIIILLSITYNARIGNLLSFPHFNTYSSLKYCW